MAAEEGAFPSRFASGTMWAMVSSTPRMGWTPTSRARAKKGTAP